MKLRLPHRFQAALLAAIASVSFTTLSSGTIAAVGAALLTGQKAQASTAAELNAALSELRTLNQYMAGEDYTFSFTLTTVGSSGTGSVLTLDSADKGGTNYYFVTQIGNYGGLSGVTNDAQGGWTAPDTHTVDGLNVWTKKDQRVTGWITRDANGTGTGGSSLNGSTITVKYSAATNTTTFELYHANKGTTDRVIMTGVALNAGNFNFDDRTNAGTDLVFRAGTDYVWNGKEGSSTWNTTNENWLNGATDAALTSTGNAMFTTSDAVKSVTIGENVTARNMVVQDDYTFVMGGHTVGVSAGMELASGKTLTLDGAGTLSVGVNIAGGGNLTKTGSGNLNLNTAANLGTLTIDSGNTLTVNGGAVSVTSLAGAGTLDIAADAEVSNASGTSFNGVKLAGSGLYALKSGSGVMTAGFSDNWAGKVKVSGSVDNLNMVNLGTANSTIVLDGWSGSFSGSPTITSDVEIGSGGASITNGNGSNTITFAGALTGSGDITRTNNNNNNVNLAFTGDVSGYTGNIIFNRCHNDFSLNVTFSGSANEINAAALMNGDKAAGTFNVTFAAADTVVNSIISRNITNQWQQNKLNVLVNADTTFKKDVTVDNLTIANGKHATFEGATSVKTSTSFGGMVTNKGAMTLNGTVAATSADLDNYELYKEGETKTYSGSGDYAGSGFLTTDNQYYLVKNVDGGTLTSTATASGEGLAISVAEDESGLVFSRSTQGTVYYINKALSYNAGQMDSATAISVAQGITFSASGANLAGKELILAQGATWQSNGATNFNNQQVQTLTLHGDATVTASGGNCGIAGPNATGATSMNLGGHTLSVNGGNHFALFNTTATDAGTIQVNNNGYLQVGHSGKTSSANLRDVVVNITSGGHLTLDNNSTITVEGLTGSGTIQHDTGGAAGATIIIEADRGDYTFSGSMTAGKNVTMAATSTGTQTFNLSGNTTLGTVTVNGGTLNLSSTGTLSANAVTVGANGTLGLGSTLTVTNALTFESGSTLDLSHYRGTVSTDPVTLATAGSISGFGGGMTVVAPVAPQGFTANVTEQNNSIVLTLAPKEGSTMHLYILTGQSNSLGSVKGNPAPADLFAQYASGGLLYNGNMHKGGSRYVADPNWKVVDVQPKGEGDNSYAVTGPEYVFQHLMIEKGWFSDTPDTDSIGVIKASLDGGGDEYWVKGGTNSNYGVVLDTVIKGYQKAVALGYGNVTIDGLLYLQGESNGGGGTERQTRYTNFLSNLKDDLEAAGINTTKIKFGDNSILGEPATWHQNDTSVGDESNAGDTHTQLETLAANSDKIGFVYTRDLDKITSGDSYGVHYNGEAQITIGARYAYAFAVQNGKDVSYDLGDDVKGVVRGDNDEKALTEAGAWWKGSAPTSSNVVVWDVSSVSTPSAAVQLQANHGNYIADGATFAVGGIYVADAYKQMVTINGGTISLGGAGITLAEGGLTANSAVTVRESQTWQSQNGHALAVNGTTTISEGATLTFADDLYLTFGAITGTGNLAIGKVTFDMDMDYMLANGMGEYVSSTGPGENGFFSGNLNLVKLTGANSQITFTGDGGSIANITKAGDLASHSIALSSDNKALQLTDLQPESTVYYARSGAVEYTASDAGQNGIYTAQQVALAGSATNPAVLTLSSALKDGVTIKSEGLGGTINIASGIELAQGSVNASGAPVVLAGQGTFALAANTKALPQNVTLADETTWLGTVKIANTSGTAGYDINLNALGNANSTVEFDGVTAYLNTASYTYTPNIRLTGEGLNIDAGTSDKTYTFNGDVTGSGKLNLSLSRGSNNHTYVFAGDVENWTGEIQAPGNRTLTVKFAGKADTVNAAITKKSGGTLHLVADTNTTFKAAISGLSSLAVSANKSATFESDLTTDSTTLNAGSTLTITGSGKTYNLGTVNTGTGTLDLVTSVSTGNMTVAAGSTLKLAGAGEGLLTVGGALTLQAGSRLDLARIFASPVQSAPLFSAVGGEIVAPANGNTYILATANSIGSLDGVELANIAQGYTGTLSTQDAGGSKQLILTLAAVTEEFIWNGGDGTWDTNAQHWHKAGSQESIAFTADSDARFDSASTDATVSVSGAVSAGSMAVDSGANVTLVTTADSHTLNATEGITVAQGGTLKLQGTGVTGTLSGAGVVVGDAIAADGGAISKTDVLGDLSLGSDWSGTVVLSGGAPTDVQKYTLLDNITSYFSQGNSTIRMNGVYGYFQAVDVGANLELTGNGADGTGTALTITAGNNNATTIFSGSISGNGDLVYDKDGDGANTYKFTGNISGWNGKLTNANRKSGMLTVQLAGNANVVNADIVRVGNRVMNVQVSNDAEFNGEVTDVNNFSVDSGSSATLNALTRVAAISGNGDIEVGSTGTLALTNTTAITFSGDLGVDGTLKLAGSNLLTTGTLDFGNDAILDLTNIHPGESTNPITLVSTTGGITGTLSEVELAHLTAPDGYRGVLTQDNKNLVLTFEMIANDLIWNTGSGDWDVNNTQQWHTAEDPTHTVFKTNDNVKFESGTYTATLTEGITAGTMTLDSGANLTLATGTNNLTTKDFVAEGDASLVKNGTGAVHFGNAAGEADTLQKLTVNDGTVEFDGHVTVGNIDMKQVGGNDRTLNLDGGAVGGTVDAKFGTINVGADSVFTKLDMGQAGASTAKVVVKEGAALTINQLFMTGSPNSTSTLTLEKDGVVNLPGSVTAKGLEGTGSVTRVNKGEYTANNGDFTLSNVEVSFGGDVTLGNKLVNSAVTSAHNVTLNNADNSLTSTTVTGNTLTVSANMDLGDVSVNDGGTLALTSSSPVTIGSGTIEGTLKLGKAEQFVVDSGAFTFASGSTLDLSSLSITEGTPVTLATATGDGSFTAVGLRGVELNFGGQTYDNARLAVQDNSLVLTFVEPGRDLIWQGGPGEWNTTSSNESWYHEEEGSYTMVAFEEGDNVSFSVQTYSPVALTEDIYAGDVTIDEGVEVSLTNGTAGKVELSAGDIVVSGDLTVTNVGVSADEMIINEGAHVTAAVTVEGYTGVMESTVSGSGDVTKTGAGNLNIHGDNAGFDGTLTIEQGGVIAGTSTALGNTPNVVLAGEGVELSGDIAPSGDINITSTADGTVSANITVADGAVLTFNTDAGTTVTATGTISRTITGTGDGGIYKDGEGTLVLDANNTYTGGMDIQNGRVVAVTPDALGGGIINVNSTSTLALTPATAPYHIDKLNLEHGGTIVFAGASTDKNNANLLDLDEMFLHSSSFLDFSNVTLTPPESESAKYYVARYDKAYWTEEGSAHGGVPGLVQFIAMDGINGLQANDIVSLHVDESDPNNKVLYLQVDAPHPGYYWNGRAGNNEWDISSENWSDNMALEGDDTHFEQSSKLKRVSAYFMEDFDGVPQTITLTDTTETTDTGAAEYELQDLIVGAGNYTFTSNQDFGHLIHFDTDALANVIIRKDAQLTLDKVSLGLGEGSVLHVCQGAKLTSRNATWDIYSINNEGEVDVVGTFSMEAMLGHVTNTGTFKALWEPECFASIGDIANNGDMTLGAGTLAANAFYGSGSITNDGSLTIEASLDDVIVGLPVVGSGDMHTTGGSVRLSHLPNQIPFYKEGVATVSQRSLDIGAAVNYFEEGVQLSEYTNVQAGSKATFYGGTTFASEDGSLGELTMAAGSQETPTQVTLGGYYYYEEIEDPEPPWEVIDVIEEIHDSTYNAGRVMAGDNSVLTVENGADATIESFNGGATGSLRGTIVVGAPTSHVRGGEEGGMPSYSGAQLTVKGTTNAAVLDVRDGEVDLNGYASVTTLTQSGGTAKFNDGGYVGGGTVSGGTLDIADGQVLTLGAVITETGNYTVDQTTGRIDASNLELVTDTTTLRYAEVLYNEGEEITENQSGFAASGRQYVKVFDVQNGTLTANDTVIYHKDAAGLMTLISGDDPSIDSYDPEDGWAGYGYLDIQTKQYMRYYVRDNYVSGAIDNRNDLHEPKVIPHPTVKLSDIVDAATQDDELLLENVVFDQTAYNENAVVRKYDNDNFNGTLTVDRNVTTTEFAAYTEADLFSVTAGTRAAISIAQDVVVLADQDYAGVKGTLELAGSGVYQIDNRGDLGTNVSLLGEETDGIGMWQGTVRLTGTAEGVDMSPLSVGSQGDASTIEFREWTGTFSREVVPMESDAQILLTGTGVLDNPAITFAENTEGTNLLWTNTVTGDNARLVHQQAGDLELTMTGDTFAWTGVFDQSADQSEVTLRFLLNAGTASGQGAHADTQNADVLVGPGSMLVEYGGALKNVNGNATVHSTGDLSLLYTGTGMQVNSNISKYQGEGTLDITVGNGTKAASATFNGSFTNTEDVTMTVENNSTATFDTDAELLRVVGDTGSNVVVNTGNTLSLASADPLNSYSRFYGVNNEGTIEMKAEGGDIKLIDTDSRKVAFNLGDLVLTDEAGTAAIETSGVADKTTEVDIKALSNSGNPNQVLKLTNDNATGTVNYNLGGKDSTADFTGKIAYGVNGGNNAQANLVIKGANTTDNSVLESTFADESPATANIVVDTDAAKVIGLSSDGNSANKTMVVSGSTGDNKSLEITGDDNYEYDGKLGENLDIAYTGDGQQTITGGVANFNGKVTVESGGAESGVLEILNATSVDITELTIGANDTLDLNDGGGNVGTAVVSGSVVAKGNQADGYSKVDGSLTLGKGASYDVSAAGGVGGLDLGGALTITQGATLSSGDIAKIYQMKIGDMYDLAFDVTMFNGSTTASGFEDKVSFGNPTDASTLFGDDQFWEGEYYVCFSGNGLNGGKGGNVGTVYLYKATPEPTTSTLSLLALAALAARRRRK